MTWIKLVLYSSLTPLQNLTTTKRICARVRIDSEVPIISDILSTSLQCWSHNRAVNSLHLTVSKDMSGRQLALKSILTSKQVRSWSLLGWTPACFLGQLQHYLIPHSSTSLCSPSILSLSFCVTVIMLWLTLTGTEEIPMLTGLQELSWIIIIVIERCLLGLKRHPTESRKREEKKRDKRAKRERW